MELLKQLYSIHSMSGQEGAMRKFVKNYVKGLPGDITLRQDHGNIYITKGESDTYPCLVAHLDQVQTKHSPDFKVFEENGRLFGFSFANRRLEGLGADDKNGIWIALKCLEHFPVLKVAFFKEEEIGCGGSRLADMPFFEDCRFCIQADRRNGGDCITEIGWIPLCSDQFKADLAPLMERFGYKEQSGLMTDVETLVSKGVGISCINISCGYYDPHTDHESTNIDELWNALAFVWTILTTMTGVYQHEYVEPEYHYCYDGFGGYRYYGGYDDVYIPELDDYATIEDWLQTCIYFNDDVPACELWSYVSVECDALGFGEKDFYAMYEELLGDTGAGLYPDDEMQPSYAG